MRVERATLAKLGLLGTLYLSQGLPFGFFKHALPQLLREGGYSLEAIGFSSVLAAPWALKLLWAPFVDRYGSERIGRRRSWILPAQASAAALFIALSALPAGESALGVLLAVAFVVNLIAATQDIATDALAVEMLAPHERGPGNGVQVAGFRIGMIVGGGGMLWVFGRLGWTVAFQSMAALLVVASIPIWLHREAPPAAPARAESRIGMAAALRGFLRRPAAPAMLALVGLYKAGDALGTAMLGPMLTDLGVSLERSGVLFGAAGFTSGTVGALAGGALVPRLGRTGALAGFAALHAVALLGYGAVAHSGDTGSLAWFMAVEHFAGGMATAALFTCMMDFCRPGHEAVDYTALASLQVGVSGLAPLGSGYVAKALGYPGHFALAAALGLAASVAAAMLLPRIRRAAGVHP